MKRNYFVVVRVQGSNFKLVRVNPGINLKDGSLSIPATIDKKRVVKIDADALQDCGEAVKRVYLPASVRSVDPALFRFCPNLEAVIVAKDHPTLESKDGVLFNKVKKTLLYYPRPKSNSEYVVPNGVREIARFAVENVEALQCVSIPASVKKIGRGAFGACPNLERIKVDENNRRFTTKHCVLLNKSKTALILYPPNKKNAAYAAPVGVKVVAPRAFAGARRLVRLSLPRSLKFLGDAAFADAAALETVFLPPDVERADKAARKTRKRKSTRIVYPASDQRERRFYAARGSAKRDPTHERWRLRIYRAGVARVVRRTAVKPQASACGQRTTQSDDVRLRQRPNVGLRFAQRIQAGVTSTMAKRTKTRRSAASIPLVRKRKSLLSFIR